MRKLFLVLLILFSAVAVQAEEWAPEAHYADVMGGKGEEEGGSPAAVGIAKWASEPSTGPNGRPLPLAGSWNTEAWGPAYFKELVGQGHHVLLTFTDPSFRAFFGRYHPHIMDAAMKEMAGYYRPGLEFARQHKLPIAIRGWNWAAEVANFAANRIQYGKEAGIPDESRPEAMVDGKLQKGVADPFGPLEAWRDWGRFWLGNELMRQIQEIYPDPPMVVFLNNNEAGELLNSAGVEKFDRFAAKYGSAPQSRKFMDQAVREGYAERYAAMFAAAKEVATTPAWRKNIRFVAYNTLAGTAYIGNGGPRPSIDFESETGWTKWRMYDGSMPELYDNDWQPGKSDASPNGMQTEAGNMYAMQARLFAERPDFIWTTIFWDGGVPSEVFRGRRATSKPYGYALNNARWDFARYQGWVQFSLWATRPRLAYEFRGGEPLDAVRKGTWLALLDSVDRPWKDPLFEEFWRHGELVPNTAERPAQDTLPADAPAWLKDLNRWYLLTCDANPPRESWAKSPSLSVFAQALVLGKEPGRRWLLNAHAPAGGTSNVKLTVPGYGEVRLPVVSRRGVFYLLSEADRSLKPLWNGGPEELTLTTASKWVEPGQPVTFSVKATKTTGNFRWKFGDGETLEQKALAEVKHTFKKPGSYLVEVEGSLADQTAVFVGTPPVESVVYDLPLDEAIAWEGPWAGVGKDGQTLATYRHTPNRGSGQMAVVTGGRFVADPERGRVFEITDDWGGIWLKRDKQTVITGQAGAANRTISFWFKAEDVTTRQVLYASGMETVGMNIYLDQGHLRAGSWAVIDGKAFDQDPVYGYNWNGDWIGTGPIETGTWYWVVWVLKDGSNKVEPDRQSLYLNGVLVGKAPGASIPVEYVVPRVGRTNLEGDSGPGIGQRTITRFHDQMDRDKLKPAELLKVNKLPTFRGLIDDFRFVNAAVEPLTLETPPSP